MTPDRLKQFLKIVDLGSMTEAARAVHLTQPALSRNMQLLEGELGVPIFERRGRGLTLTAGGRALVPRARELLRSLERTTREVNRSAERGYFDLRLGAVDSAAVSVLPMAFAELIAALPHLSVKLVTSRTQDLLQRVRLGELDLALVAHSGPPREVRNERVTRYNLKYYGKKSVFSKLASVTTKEQLVDFPVVEIEPPPGVAPTAPDGAHSHALVSSAATVKALVLAGVGVGDLPDFLLTKKELGGLVAARIPHDPDCGLYLAKSAAWQGRIEDKVTSELVAALRSVLR